MYAIRKEETEEGTECMGVCVGYVKRRQRVTEWVCVCRVCEREIKRDRMCEYVYRLCEEKRERNTVGSCGCSYVKGRQGGTELVFRLCERKKEK